MRRRNFIIGMAGSAAAWSTAAQAQKDGRNYRIGFLNPSGRSAPPTIAFLDELRLNGFIEGQNLEIIPGGFDLRSDQVTKLAATIVEAVPDVIYSGGEVATRAVQAETKTLPSSRFQATWSQKNW